MIIRDGTLKAKQIDAEVEILKKIPDKDRSAHLLAMADKMSIQLPDLPMAARAKVAELEIQKRRRELQSENRKWIIVILIALAALVVSILYQPPQPPAPGPVVELDLGPRVQFRLWSEYDGQNGQPIERQVRLESSLSVAAVLVIENKVVPAQSIFVNDARACCAHSVSYPAALKKL